MSGAAPTEVESLLSVLEREDLWDVARPARPSRVAGVDMAGFRDRGRTPVGLRLIPHPAVTVALVFGGGTVAVDDASGRQRRSRARCWAPHRPTWAAPWWPWTTCGAGRRPGSVSGWATCPPGRTASLRVDELAAELGWSRKRLWSRFHAQIGLPPKRAAKLVRFDRAAHRLAAGQAASRVAADGGYTDQSHLHRDVMAFTGTTPATVPSEPFLAIDDVAWPATKPRPTWDQAMARVRSGTPRRPDRRSAPS
jgi:AraC-like DNA-binding protein